MAAVAAFTHDHWAWFRLWLPLGETTPSRDTYLRLVRRLGPETAVKAALWLPGDQPARPGGTEPGPGAVRYQEQRDHGPPPLAQPHPPGGGLTIDAAGCQTAIVQALREAGTNYVLALGATSGPCTGR